MRFSFTFLAKGILASLGALLCACPGPPPPVNDFGTVEFQYVLLAPDESGAFVAVDCDSVAVESIRFAVGEDLNQDGILSPSEELDAAIGACNQFDFNLDGIFTINEIGLWGPTPILAGFFPLFSIQVLDFSGRPIPWSTFDSIEPGTRFTFTGLEVVPGINNFISFGGDVSQLENELQIFLF